VNTPARIQAYYQPILDSYPGAWCVADMDERIVALNNAMAEVFGQPAHSLIGKRVTDVSPAPERSREMRDRVLRYGYAETEERKVTPENSTVLRYVCWLIRKSGEPIGIACFLRQEVTSPHAAQLLLPEQVAQYLQISMTTLRRMIRAGEIPALRIERQYRFRATDIQAWLERQRIQT